MVSDEKSKVGPMTGRSRGTPGRTRDGRSRQTLGVDIDTIPMVRPSTSPLACQAIPQGLGAAGSAGEPLNGRCYAPCNKYTERERSEVAPSSKLLPSLNRRDQRSGNHGRKSTGETRGLYHPETARKRRLRSSGATMKDRW
jgi:hypothetical protein